MTLRAGALAALLWAGNAAAAAEAPCTFFVRAGFVPAGGVALADGRSPATALASIGAALPRLANPGEVLCVGPGVYREGNLSPNRSGVDGYPIELRGDPSGASTGDPPGPVRIAPPDGLPPEAVPTAAFRLLGRRHIVIEGFTIDGFFDAGIQVRSAVTGTAQSGDVTIRGNDVRRSGKTGIDVAGEGRMVVEGNQALGNGGSGISIRRCGAGVVDPRCRAGAAGPLEPIVSNNRTGVNEAHGLFIQDAQRGVVQNNVAFSNRASGITLRAAPDFFVVNNLVYRNDGAGIAVGSADLAAPDAVLANNTLYDNLSWGIEIGSGGAASPGALVVYNVLERNGVGAQGIGVLNENDLPVRSTCGYVAGFNVTADGYGPKTPWNVFDVRASPRFVEPVAGPDGLLGGYRDGDAIVDGSADDHFALSQWADGTGVLSPGVDLAPVTAEAAGLRGSTAIDGRPDAGLLDAGFHAGAPAAQAVVVQAPRMPLYVRRDGDDRRKGRRPADAFASIKAAAQRARAGVSVVVGPGVYPECDLGPPPDMGRAAFVADPSGAETGDAPGPVLVDAGCCRGEGECRAGETGFNVGNSCGIVIDGFHVRGAFDDGVQIHSGSHEALVRNTVAFSNQRRGIHLIDSHDARIVNNLVYDNTGGIQVGGRCRADRCDGAGSMRVAVEHNTCYANAVNGILIGAGAGVSSHALVRYNITHPGNAERQPPGENGIQIGSNTTSHVHRVGYRSAFNVNFLGRYGAGTPRGPSDRIDDPRFVAPAGFDGVLGGDGFEDDSFHLAQMAAGDGYDSPALDFSDQTAAAVGLGERSTRVDGVPDEGLVDLGYHYPAGTAVRWRTGDCNLDGRVSIDEIVRAVRIALGEFDLAACPAVDFNADGRVAVDELTRAIRVVLNQGD